MNIANVISIKIPATGSEICINHTKSAFVKYPFVGFTYSKVVVFLELVVNAFFVVVVDNDVLVILLVLAISGFSVERTQSVCTVMFKVL